MMKKDRKRAWGGRYFIKDEKYMVCLDGKGEASVCGCRSIAEYSESLIVLRLIKNNLTIRGESLTLKSYYPDEIKIKGRIYSLEISSFREAVKL